MNRTGAITMSMRELDRLKILQSLADGNLKPKLAAKRLGLSTRQVLRLSNRFRDDGSEIGRYIDVFEYPDGHIELRADGIALPYSTYDKLSEINQGAIVENKRL